MEPRQIRQRGWHHYYSTIPGAQSAGTAGPASGGPGSCSSFVLVSARAIGTVVAPPPDTPRNYAIDELDLKVPQWQGTT